MGFLPVILMGDNSCKSYFNLVRDKTKIDYINKYPLGLNILPETIWTQLNSRRPAKWIPKTILAYFALS